MNELVLAMHSVQDFSNEYWEPSPPTDTIHNQFYSFLWINAVTNTQRKIIGHLAHEIKTGAKLLTFIPDQVTETPTRQNYSSIMHLALTVNPKIRFKQLANEWKTQTGHISFVSNRIQHPAYRKILLMGKTAVPLILEEMDHDKDHWFHALYTITGENPLPDDFNGSISEARDIWLKWGKERYAA
jgi:hypothetical protein